MAPYNARPPGRYNGPTFASGQLCRWQMCCQRNERRSLECLHAAAAYAQQGPGRGQWRMVTCTGTGKVAGAQAAGLCTACNLFLCRASHERSAPRALTVPVSDRPGGSDNSDQRACWGSGRIIASGRVQLPVSFESLQLRRCRMRAKLHTSADRRRGAGWSISC